MPTIMEGIIAILVLAFAMIGTAYLIAGREVP